ncbi:cyclohexyl-isocyanide hydratase [Desulfuromusa kysingii]|uniref:Cyclohexyl-isocyanide hydratase n=1 Tax=Desulfuromusa kysingii TaxID=37625 RepID=A0A1H3ZLC2_9BACT|nr:DJ-1/PfpI family protein [Desulfuromusa kysingii]SEA24596.1 cyclohexyl-isocyanide hydratase [Desulfuromusa kysingii]
MKAAFIIFDQMTALDFVGVYDPLTRLKTMDFMPKFHWQICSFCTDVADNQDLRFNPDSSQQPLGDFDLLVVPGGYGSRSLQHNEGFISWLKTAKEVPLKASVCTGSLLLGAAGFLSGKRATTHPNAYDELARYCGEVSQQRVVDAGDVITARGVTSAIDLGLYLVERIAGKEIRIEIARQMDYPYFS